MSEQMCAAQWTKVKATVTICNYYMTMLVGVKCAKGVTTAVLGAVALATPGDWGHKPGKYHIVPARCLPPH